MGQEHVELIRRAFEAMNARDIEGAKALAHPEIDLKTRFTGVAGRPYRGFEGVEQWFADVGETWEDVNQTIERFIEVDDERTIAVISFHGRGKGSGIELDQELANIWRIRHGKVMAVETYPSVDEALAAAGVKGATGG
jgi:ketosteroid isomerase-like protein